MTLFAALIYTQEDEKDDKKGVQFVDNSQCIKVMIFLFVRRNEEEKLIQTATIKTKFLSINIIMIKRRN